MHLEDAIIAIQKEILKFLFVAMERNTILSFFISLFLHLSILMIPMSKLVVDSYFREVEFVILGEEPIRIVSHKKEILDKNNKKSENIQFEKKTEESVEKDQIKESPKEIVENLFEKNVVEVNKDSKKQEYQETVIGRQTNDEKVNLITRVEQMTQKESKQLIDIEFGKENGPKFLHREIPKYPLIARKLGKEGKVVLRLTIDEMGKLINLEIVEDAGYGFTDSAIEAIRKSTFLPATINGKPVLSKAILPIKFNLRRD